MAKEEFMEIGVAALIDPVTGEFGPSFSLYMKATDQAIASRERVYQELGNIFAEKFAEYVEKCQAAGVKV